MMRKSLPLLLVAIAFVPFPRDTARSDSSTLKKMSEFDLPGPPGKRFDYLLLGLFVGVTASAQKRPTNESTPQKVVFICEHGAALSVVAAAYFNKLAKEQHLGFRAVPRGVTPQENLSPQATAGLKQDGLAPEIRSLSDSRKRSWATPIAW